MATREASHAGSWYTSNGKRLNKELSGWLQDVGDASPQGEPLPIRNLRAIIAPHAGYSYSGPSAGYAYRCIDPTKVQRVFILGPSHHVYLTGCALTKCETYATPLGSLLVDQEVNELLARTGHFGHMSQDTDENEHSIEMHLPYLYKALESKIADITIVPILIGALSHSKEVFYGKLLAPYLKDPANLFVVSSDFCHWGARFDYTYYVPGSIDAGKNQPANVDNDEEREGQTEEAHGSHLTRKSHLAPTDRPIHESIRKVDLEGMSKIESKSHAAFDQYLKRTRNTICGRHPIGVLLASIENLEEGKPRVVDSQPVHGKSPEFHVKFVHYAQSSAVKAVTDSSVSYASAFVQLV